MKYLVQASWSAVSPIVELTAPRELIQFIDKHFTVLSAGATLFIALVMWANI
jgi:hypothetical protein